MSPRTAATGLLVVAGAHTVPAVYLGTQDGDFSLLWVALPFVVLSCLAAVAVLNRQVVAIALASIALALALGAVPLYLLGVLHLGQAVVGLVLTVRNHP